MTYYKHIISTVISLCLFIIILFSSMEIIIYNSHYYEWHYKERNIMAETNMDLESLLEVTEKMLDYLKDKRDNLDMTANIDGKVEEVFGEREKLHMVDVKDLFVKAIFLRNISIIFVLIAFIAIFHFNKKMLINVFFSIKYVFGLLIMLILVLSSLLYFNFNKYFTIFHEMFFSNDLWLLNPATDVLINMVPEIFFFTTALLIILIFLVMTTVVLITLEYLAKRLSSFNR